MGRAISRVLRFDAGSAEGKDLEPIEVLRNRLKLNQEWVSFRDYGAGSPNADRSADEMRRGVIKRVPLAELVDSSKDRLWALLLFEIIREFRRECCLELGTCLGISAAYQGVALALNGKGKLLTIEGAPEVAGLARSHLDELRVDTVEVLDGRFDDVLPTVLREGVEFDYAFIDGHHDEEATGRYFEMILPHLSEDAVVVVDDIRWSRGMFRAWNRILNDPAVGTVFDFGDVGVLVLDRAGTGRKYQIPLY